MCYIFIRSHVFFNFCSSDRMFLIPTFVRLRSSGIWMHGKYGKGVIESRFAMSLYLDLSEGYIQISVTFSCCILFTLLPKKYSTVCRAGFSLICQYTSIIEPLLFFHPFRESSWVLLLNLKQVGHLQLYSTLVRQNPFKCQQKGIDKYYNDCPNDKES